jgi:hypothetical protein
MLAELLNAVQVGPRAHVKRFIGFFFVILFGACFVSRLIAQTTADTTNQLYQQFIDPPRDFSPMPFWFWNGKLDGPTIQAQIRAMTDQHVYGSFLHARDGLETPYLSDDWWKAIGAGLTESKKVGFEFNFVDEYDWPSGEARNVWMAGNHQSEVLAAHPDFRMKTLAYDSKIVQGPQVVELPADADVQAVVAARWLGQDRIDAKSLTAVDVSKTNGHIRWTVPEGEWVILQFHLEPAMGFDGGFVDLMNPDAMKLYFQLTYEQYHRRFGSYFGNTIHYSFSDHEGDYGYRIAWTPALFHSFQERTGYDLRKTLPLLIYDGGDFTTKVRTDYLSTVTHLYAASFWNGITDSASKLGIHRTGHAWEESLQWAAALEGSLFTVERGLNPVGVDSLEDFGRQPLNFKVAQSVADYEGRRFMCENQGVQGTNSYLDMEGIRKGTNAIGAWGVNLFVPHAFDYDAKRANYPPDWLHQPYWSYFHYYADYTRRISYMNADSQHITNVLLYYPITTMWADTAPLFSGSTSYQKIGQPAAWKNQTILINDYYTRLILGMAKHHWDYNIADDHYLENARIVGNELIIGPQHFRAIVLPPITTLSRKTLAVLQRFHQAGGILLAIRMLPTASPEAGGNDPVIRAGIASLFGQNAQAGDVPSGVSQQTGGGTYYVADSVDSLIRILDTKVPKDTRITSGRSDHLYFEHRKKLQTDYYWVVNDTDTTRVNEVQLSAKGIPEKWNALTGKREPLFYVNTASGTEIRLTLAPWDACYIIFKPLAGSSQTAKLVATNAESIDDVSDHADSVSIHVTSPVRAAGTYVELRKGDVHYKATIPGNSDIRPVELTGEWQFHPSPKLISVPYAKVSDGSEAKGESLGWEKSSFDDTGWPSMWLSKEQQSIRNWKMIGPFPNKDNDGFAAVYPPEKAFDVKERYRGLEGQIVGWHDYYGNEPHLALQNWNIWMTTEGGRFSESGYIAQFNPELLTNGDTWIVSYAHTYLYSPRNQQAVFIVAADNWDQIWLNHQKVFEQLRTPFWYELNDNWANRIPVDLHTGWNEVLVKVGKGRGVSSGFYGFAFRVADENGNNLQNIVASVTGEGPGKSRTPVESMRWYRVEVPPGCIGIVRPALHDPYRILVNGHEVSSKSKSPINLSGWLHESHNAIVIVAREDDPLDSPVEFLTGATPFTLKPWTQTGLANFSGTAVYEKTFSLPDSFHNKRILIDLGRVSSVAEVYVNGKHAGTSVWQPYRLDISNFVKPGNNHLKVVVTNTEANRRAVGTWHHILPAIDNDGMEGPVRIVPYFDEVVRLHRIQ